MNPQMWQELIGIKGELEDLKYELQMFSLKSKEGGQCKEYVDGLFLGIEAYIRKEWPPDDSVQGQNVLQQPKLYMPTGKAA